MGFQNILIVPRETISLEDHGPSGCFDVQIKA